MKTWASNSILVSCQPQWVTSGQPNSVTRNCTLKYAEKDFRKGGFKEGCSLILANFPQGFLCDNTDTLLRDAYKTLLSITAAPSRKSHMQEAPPPFKLKHFKRHMTSNAVNTHKWLKSTQKQQPKFLFTMPKDEYLIVLYVHEASSFLSLILIWCNH